MSSAEQREIPEASGQRLGRYRLISQLGQGGMGAIHLAVTCGMGEFRKLVVLKELRPDLSQDAEFVSMFEREVKLAGLLNHKNVVQTIEAGHAVGRHFMAMEFLDGQTFSRLMTRATNEERVPLRLRLQIISEVLAGLHYAHELTDYDHQPLNVIHCDVCFANVFVTYDGAVKLVDFGIARMAQQAATAGFQGRIRYASPEQLRDEDLDARSDVFAVGVMLWETLALRRMHDKSASVADMVEARIREQEPKLSSVAPHIDAELVEICDRALCVNRENRFATAQEFRAALMKYMAKLGAPVEAAEISALMKSEFSSELERAHQHISEHLSHTAAQEGPSFFDSEPGHDDVTTVADLSPLVESLTPFNGTRTARSRAPQKRSPWMPILLVGFSALGAGAMISFGVSSEPQADAGVAGENRTGELPAALPSQEPERVDPVPSAATEPDKLSDKELTAEEVQTPPQRVGKRRVWRRRRRVSQKETEPVKTESTGDSTVDVSEPSAPSDPAATKPKADVLDQHLNPRNKNEVRAIDSENPFK